MKAVFDTNVLVSALITTGKPKELFLKAIEGQIQLVLSRGILEEFTEVAVVHCKSERTTTALSIPFSRKRMAKKRILFFMYTYLHEN